MALKNPPAKESKWGYTDYEVSHPNLVSPKAKQKNLFAFHTRFFILGTFMGIVLTKAEVISWFRMQEMFRLQSFHMFGLMGSAMVVGIVSLWCIKKFKIKTMDGEPIILAPKKFNKGQVYGGLLFGFGWAMTGACPGPIFAQIGSGATVAVVILVSAIAGTWVYGWMREKLPH